MLGQGPALYLPKWLSVNRLKGFQLLASGATKARRHAGTQSYEHLVIL